MSQAANMTLGEGEGIDWGPKHEKQVTILSYQQLSSETREIQFNQQQYLES